MKILTSPKTLLFRSTVLLLFLTFATNQLFAQPKASNLGIGLQLGQPSGVSLKFYSNLGVSIDVLAAWDLDDFFFINAHGLFEKPIGNARGFGYFYGPGAFFGIRDGNDRSGFGNDIVLGISGTIGMNFFIDQFEIYIRLTPRLALIDAVDGDIGGGLGFRYFF